MLRLLLRPTHQSDESGDRVKSQVTSDVSITESRRTEQAWGVQRPGRDNNGFPRHEPNRLLLARAIAVFPHEEVSLSTGGARALVSRCG